MGGEGEDVADLGGLLEFCCEGMKACSLRLLRSFDPGVRGEKEWLDIEFKYLLEYGMPTSPRRKHRPRVSEQRVAYREKETLGASRFGGGHL